MTVFAPTGGHGSTVVCPFEPVDVNTVTLESLPPGVSTSGRKSATVNGIKVFEAAGTGPMAVDALVPSLGVEVQANGPLATKILGTLSRSARAVALAGGRAPRVPRSWRRITDGGLRVRVPAAWPVHHVTDWGSACQPPSELTVSSSSQPSVTLDEGKEPPPVPCPLAIDADQPIPTPVNGLTIDPGPDGPLSGATSFGPCKSIHGLQVCPARGELEQNGGLVLRVRTPSGATVAVVIGLAGKGKTARTILYSLRPA